MPIDFTGERIVPGAANCEPTFAQKMYQEHVVRYAFAAQLVQGKDVLDLGCGVGYGSQLLAKSGAKSVLGIDIADDAIEHARKNYFHPAVSYSVQDARALDFSKQFDLVTCFEFIEHVDEQVRVLDVIKQALRPGGTLVLSTPRPLDEIRTEFHVHELDYEELRRMLVERFADVESFFERNCFTSFIGAGAPDILDRIITVTDKLQLDDADYFIFVGHNGERTSNISAKPVLAVNDDSYVLRLEQDAIEFRNGENYHKQLIDDLSKRCESLTSDLDVARSELGNWREREDNMDLVRNQLVKIGAELSSLQRAVVDGETTRDRAAALEIEAKGLRKDLAAALQARDSVLRGNQDLAADNSRIRTVLSKAAQKLAETETRLNAKLAEADLLAQERSLVAEARDEHAREMHALSVRLEETERTLNRFRGSFSWSVTRPLRWIGRQYKKLVGRSAA